MQFPTILIDINFFIVSSFRFYQWPCYSSKVDAAAFSFPFLLGLEPVDLKSFSLDDDGLVGNFKDQLVHVIFFFKLDVPIPKRFPIFILLDFQ